MPVALKIKRSKTEYRHTLHIQLFHKTKTFAVLQWSLLLFIWYLSWHLLVVLFELKYICISTFQRSVIHVRYRLFKSSPVKTRYTNTTTCTMTYRDTPRSHCRLCEISASFSQCKQTWNKNVPTKFNSSTHRLGVDFAPDHQNDFDWIWSSVQG